VRLAYYSATAHADFWTEHWGAHTVDELLAVARESPLTTLIVDALPPAGIVLEAGCGLAQYVILLRERGWRAVGVDASVEALASGRRRADVPLAASDLRALAIRSGAVAAYVSLGVIEHDPAGPDAILAEARRVLAPQGMLIVSVPYVNGLRRIGAPWLRRRGRAVAAAGGAFYQYAFSRRELLAVLDRHGFAALAVRPYDPARILRRVLPGRGTARRHRAGTGSSGPAASRAVGRGQWIRGLARGALYTEPALRLLGHMLLVVARRA